MKFLKDQIRKCLGDWGFYQMKILLGRPLGAFHDDQITWKLVRLLVRAYEADSLVETGLFQGATTRYLAHHYPHLPVHSFEVSPVFFKDCSERLKLYPNIFLHLGSSETALRCSLEKGELGKRPLFYLDAHWYDYWPLKDEMSLIGEYLEEAVILIDDFEVPGCPEFVFDTGASYEGGNSSLKCNLEFIRSALSSRHAYQVYYPRCSSLSPGSGKQVGYGLILQNPSRKLLDDLESSAFFQANFSKGEMFENVKKTGEA